MLKAHFIFFHLNMNYSAGGNLCFCREWVLSLFYLSSIREVFFDCLHHLFCGNKSLLFYQGKNHFNNHLEQGEERKVFWRKIIPFPYFS